MSDAPQGQAPVPPPTATSIAAHDLLGKQVWEVSNEAQAEERSARRAALAWKYCHIVLGMPAAVIAAISAAAGFASAAGRIPAAILALGAAGISAAATFLNGEARSAEAERRRAAWSTLGGDARLIAAIDGTRGTAIEIANQISILFKRREEIRLGNYDAANEMRDRGLANWDKLVTISTCHSALVRSHVGIGLGSGDHITHGISAPPKSPASDKPQ